MNAFKLRYKKNDSMSAVVTNWMTEDVAREWFDQLKANEKCEWCELLYTPEDEEYILDEFVKG